MYEPESDPFPPISTRLTNELREEIIAQQRPPGSHLKEPELALRFGVSRGPVREALARLAGEGLVSLSRRRGATVVTFSAEDVVEIYSLRASLESLAVRRIYDRYPDRIPKLCRILDDIADQMPTYEAEQNTNQLQILDYQFHKHICEAAEHRRLIDSWIGIASQIRACTHMIEEFRPFDFEQEHKRLAQALRSNDKDYASATIQWHIEQAGAVLETQFNDLESSKENKAS